MESKDGDFGMSEACCSPTVFNLCARHCFNDQSNISAAGVFAASPSRSPCSRASSKKSASSLTVIGMPIGILSMSCMGKDAKCIPQPSPGEVHCRLTPFCPSSPPSSGIASSPGGCDGSHSVNSQTSANTLLGAAGDTTPRCSVLPTAAASSRLAVAELPRLSRRSNAPAPPPPGAPALPWPTTLGRCCCCRVFTFGLGCCSPSTVASTVCTGSSASTARMRERSGSASKTCVSLRRCRSSSCAERTFSGPGGTEIKLPPSVDVGEPEGHFSSGSPSSPREGDMASEGPGRMGASRPEA
mmetsp:Transcript_52278/g.150558  ORF Transcript_52278/g.150558 Transcript_52278/m.150558 type:complete len:299 (-) Transcript_52278:36-932(-)